MPSRPVIGVLALQGDFEAHQRAFDEIGASTRQVRTAADLAAVDALVLPGGESTRRFQARVLATVRQLLLAHPGQRLTVVTHGGVLDMLWRTAKGHALDGLRDCAIPNAGINRLRWVNDQPQIDDWADDSHLAGLPPQAPT